ncbi:MAG: hypothetical protein SH850_02175 [Planctomycetaceae bacterium]|nr:hypothetical protein [Planctomycetaceae bacterium]
MTVEMIRPFRFDVDARNLTRSFFNHEEVAKRSRGSERFAQTHGKRRHEALHPGGMPEIARFWHPSGMRFSYTDVRGSAQSLRPPATVFDFFEVKAMPLKL